MRIAALALCALALGGCLLPRLDNSALTQNSNSTENVVKSTNVETANQSMSNDGQKTGATYTDEGIASKVGIAAHFGNDSGCLRTQNAKLMSGQRIFVVNDPSVIPQKLIKAVIVEKLSVSCADDSDIGDSAELLEKTSYYKIERYYRDEVETNGIFWGLQYWTSQKRSKILTDLLLLILQMMV
ncbi:MAG: hypothetical protein ACKVQW_00855 [Pyrinomonadaceae bacterium]